MHYFTGLKQIRKWTKESLKEKPFSTAKGKVWTETPSSIPLDKIYTNLKWVKKGRETYGVQTQEFEDITKLLDLEQAEDDAARIGVTGKNRHSYQYGIVFLL